MCKDECEPYKKWEENADKFLMGFGMLLGVIHISLIIWISTSYVMFLTLSSITWIVSILIMNYQDFYEDETFLNSIIFSIFAPIVVYMMMFCIFSEYYARPYFEKK